MAGMGCLQIRLVVSAIHGNAFSQGSVAIAVLSYSASRTSASKCLSLMFMVNDRMYVCNNSESATVEASCMMGAGAADSAGLVTRNHASSAQAACC